MEAIKMIAIVLIVAGVLGLVYGGFTYTKSSTDNIIPDNAVTGKVDVTTHSDKKVNVPIWAGVAGVAVGSLLLLGSGMVASKKT